MMYIVLLRSNRILAVLCTYSSQWREIVGILRTFMIAVGVKGVTCEGIASIHQALEQYRLADKLLPDAQVAALQQALDELTGTPFTELAEVKYKFNNLVTTANMDARRAMELQAENAALRDERNRANQKADQAVREAAKAEAREEAKTGGPALSSTPWGRKYTMTAEQERRIKAVLAGETDRETGFGPAYSSNLKINAIKLLRVFKDNGASMGLKEAKDAIEELMGEKPL